MEITKDEFRLFEGIRRSGVTNMHDVRYVKELSDGLLTREKQMRIWDEYKELYIKVYGVWDRE